MAAGKFAGNGGDRSSKIYFNLSNGKLVREWNEEPKQEWIPDNYELKTRIISKGKNEGKTKWYIEYDYVDGNLIDVKFERMDGGGDRVALTMYDVMETYIVQINLDSAYGRDFMNKMWNIDVTKKLMFKPWLMNPDQWKDLTGKTVTSDKVGLSFLQEEIVDGVPKNVSLPKFYTKDNPNGLPELIKEIVKGKDVWNSKDRDNFLYEETLKWIESTNKVLASATAPVGGGIGGASEGEDVDILDDISDDDLPF